MERRMIAPCFMDDTLECLRRHGVDAEPLLAQTGLPSVVTGPVSAEQYGAFWHAVAQAMDDEFFGEGARPMRAGSFALLCHAILSTVTLEHALEGLWRLVAVTADDLPDAALGYVAAGDQQADDKVHQPFAFRLIHRQSPSLPPERLVESLASGRGPMA